MISSGANIIDVWRGQLDQDQKQLIQKIEGRELNMLLEDFKKI